MIKISRKILPGILTTALLVIAGGFSDGMIASASMNGSMMNEFGGQNQTMVSYHQNRTALAQGMPMDNTLKPCCQDKQGNALAVANSAFSQNMKSLMIGFVDYFSNTNYVFEHKISQLSSASPPKPDILSSVCLKE